MPTKQEKRTLKTVLRQRDEARAEAAKLRDAMANSLVHAQATKVPTLEQQLVELRQKLEQAQHSEQLAMATANAAVLARAATEARVEAQIREAVVGVEQSLQGQVDQLQKRLASETVEDLRTLRRRLAKKAEEEKTLREELQAFKASEAKSPTVLMLEERVAYVNGKLAYAKRYIGWINAVLKNDRARKFLAELAFCNANAKPNFDSFLGENVDDLGERGKLTALQVEQAEAAMKAFVPAPPEAEIADPELDLEPTRP